MHLVRSVDLEKYKEVWFMSIKDMLTSNNVVSPAMPIILPPKCLLYLSPRIQRGGKTLFNYAKNGNWRNGTAEHIHASLFNCKWIGDRIYTDGSNDSISIADNSNIDILTATPQQPLSMFIVVKIAAGASSGNIMSKCTNGTANTQYGLTWLNTNRLVNYIENTAEGDTGTNVVYTDKWYLVGAIWNGAYSQVYVNLLAKGSPSATATLLTTRANFRIGRYGAGATCTNMTIKDVFICQSPWHVIKKWMLDTKFLQLNGVIA